MATVGNIIKMTVEIIKGTKRISAAQRIICQRELPYKKIILLPIPSTRDGINVSGTDITLESLTFGIHSGVAVCGYGLPQWFVSKLEEAGACVYDALHDESFQQKNAELTALGALGDIITVKSKAPSDVRFGIIGYGRIGSALLKYLCCFGAKPIIFTRRESVCRMLGEWGIDSTTSMRLEDYTMLDVLINTAPAPVVDAGGALALHAAGVSMFELASGENFGHAEQVVRLLGVPDKVFPESAGIAYAEAICSALLTVE